MEGVSFWVTGLAAQGVSRAVILPPTMIPPIVPPPLMKLESSINRPLLGLVASCLCAGQVVAASLTWDGGSTTGPDWNTSVFGFLNGYNWNPNANPTAGDQLAFAGGARTTSNNNTTSGTSYGSITFNSGAAAFTLTGNSITLGGNLTNNSSNLQKVNLPVILSATRTFDAASGSLAVGGVISGAGGLTKTGTQALTLTETNSYKGATSVNAGKLVINGDQSSATGNVTVAAGGSLAGTGNVGGATTVQTGGEHSAGDFGTVGTQTFKKSLNYASGSIFAWDVVSDSSYDKIDAAGQEVTGSNAVFQVVSGQAYTTPFWDSNRTWTDIFTTGSGSLASVFGSITGTGIRWDGSKGVVAGQGSFTISGNSLNWSAVPEPTSALAGLLLGAGLLARRRPQTD